MLERSEKISRLETFLRQIAPNNDPVALETEPGLETLESLGTDQEIDRANNGIRKLVGGQAIEDPELDALEAIVLPRERPVVDIRQDSYAVPPPPWQHLDAPQTRAKIESAIPSIGRVELPNHPAVPYGGTGFVVGQGLIMTNRHVAEIFCSGLGLRGLHFHPGQTAALDFRQEAVPGSPIFVNVQEVLMIHPYWDMALLKVEGLSELQKPLDLSVSHPDDLQGRDVAVVGYPAFDSRNDPALQNRIFRGIFNVKRLQPGKIMGRERISSFHNPVNGITHDSSTLGGNSGSAVIDIQTGEVVGLHFAGLYLKANYAVPSYELGRDSRVVDAGVHFSGRLTATDEWTLAWTQADPAGEEGSDSPARRGPSPRPNDAPVAPCPAPDDTGDVAVTCTVPLRISFTLGRLREGGDSTAGLAALPEVPGLRISPQPDYRSRRGYSLDFLGPDFEIRLPWLTEQQYRAAAFNRQAERARHVLPYHHFSIVMNRTRRLAFYTAVNIDGRREKQISRSDFSDAWFLDPRIDPSEQLQNDLYYDNKLDRGHLVRRLDPVWGLKFAAAKAAHDDTFHWTNCSPQHERFNRNQTTWGLVENWILQQAHAKDQRVTVFTGPVFRDDDPVYTSRTGDQVKIPLTYWKVVAMIRQDGTLSGSAYLLSQKGLVDDMLTEALVPEPKTFQKSVKEIEDLTHLCFFQLRDHDRLAERAVEGVDRPLLSFRDIVL